MKKCVSKTIFVFVIRSLPSLKGREVIQSFPELNSFLDKGKLVRNLPQLLDEKMHVKNHIHVYHIMLFTISTKEEK